MSLLSICQEIAEEIPAAVPTSIVGNQDQTAQVLLVQAQRAGEALARKPQNGWIAMIREFDFTSRSIANLSGSISTVGGFAVITGLPANSTLPITIGDAWYGSGPGVTNNSTVTATTQGVTDTVTLSKPATATTTGIYVFSQSDYPLPTDFQRIIDNTIWDRSRFWSMRGPQSPQQWQLYKSSVIGRASIQRRWRFRNASWLSGVNSGQQLRFSIDPVPTDNGSSFVFEYVSNAWCASQSGTPQVRWQADTDVGILDEYLLTLGTRWRVFRRLGMSYSEELNEYQMMEAKAIAHDGGAPILDLTPPDRLTLIGPWNLPETGFGPSGT